MSQENTGWVCPRCGSVNSPQKDKCKCPPNTESTEPPKKELILG
jgi:uncharacterized OB-fold protein